jgi:hypothetical protein
MEVTDTTQYFGRWWDEAIGPNVKWQDAYPQVAAGARAALMRFPSGGNRTTAALVEALYPEHMATGPGIWARNRLFKALSALTVRSLADCCTQGPPQKARFGAIRRWSWHAPDPNYRAPPAICAGCGRPL